MPTLQVEETVRVLGSTYSGVKNITSDGSVTKSITVPAAKTGALTTRTDADTGTLTMDSGHGITTGARLDLYWDGGSRRGLTVGTVSVDEVPIDGGAGDDLPDDETDITAMVPVEEEFLLTGDNAEALLFYSVLAGIIVLTGADDVEDMAVELDAAIPYLWTLERDPTIPVAGDTVTKAFFSHGDSTTTSAMTVVALVS